MKAPLWKLLCPSLVLVLVATVLVLWRLGGTHEVMVINVGVLMPFGTDLKAVGTKMRNGMEMAKEDLLERHKGRLEVHMDYQTGCYERDAAAAVQKFLDDGVSFIGGSFCLFGHIPILPITEANKLVTFNTAANPDVVLNRNFAFSTNVEVRAEAERMAQRAFEQMGGRRAIIMHLDTPFGHDYRKYFKRRFERLGGALLFNIPNPPDNKDFTEVIPRIREAHPDIIVTAHFGIPLGTFFRELRAAGIGAPILGNYETEDRDVLDTAGNAAEGVVISSSEPAVKTPTMARFEERYRRRFGEAPDVVVTNCYDNVILGAEAHFECRGDRDCMRETLHAIKDYQGASGVITINPSGAVTKPTRFKVVRGHAFIGID